ncbi:MAG: glycine C-acetyltransferase [Deltaproteobacteria bacterium]|nr:glycine C-acetyltransferase [Deltaproteobacteria bacterium]
MFAQARAHYAALFEELRAAGLEKRERVIVSPQGATIRTTSRDVLNFCANNYLGLSSHPAVIEGARKALETHGFGMSSVRFICGTQDLHKELEATIARYFGTDDTILYSSCFDANGGLFETLLGEEDAIISDALNHASIIDGIRLCKAERHRYPNGDMAALEEALVATQGKRIRLIATDGVFSMDGYIAKLETICELAEKYGAMVMVDDSHATGFVGPTGRGSAEHCGVLGRVDVFTSTLGKALGGGSGGFTTGRRELVELLRQRSRPYLFSNTLPPPIVGASLAVFGLLERDDRPRKQLMANTARFREGMTTAGFTIKEGIHPIVPVMIGDARKATELADNLLEKGIYVVGFSFPVVPRGEARVRVQLSAAHSSEDVERAVAAFTEAGRELGLLAD